VFLAPARQAHAWDGTFPGAALNEYTSWKFFYFTICKLSSFYFLIFCAGPPKIGANFQQVWVKSKPK